MEDVWRGINEAGIIVADLTGRNANVFYETGIAHTLGKEVILLTQDRDEKPFDISHLRYIFYEYTPPGMAKMESALTKTLNTLRARLTRRA